MMLVFAWHGVAWSGTLERLGLTEATVGSVATGLARCSGFWSAYADIETDPAKINEIDRIAREAKMAAAYLSLQVDTETRKSFGWAKSIAALEFESWNALMSIAPNEEIQDTFETCEGMIWMQESLIDIILDHVSDGD